MTNFTCSSLFTGAGFGLYGLQQAGFEPVASVEIEPHRTDANRIRWPEASHFRDITKVCGKQLPKVDLCLASPPCQSFSSGNRTGTGFEDPRGQLFWEIPRILEEQIRFGNAPKVIVVENVPDITYKPNRLGTVEAIRHFASIGFRPIAADIINARRFGVPQDRRRTFLVLANLGCQIESEQLRIVPGDEITLRNISSHWLGDPLTKNELERLRQRIERHSYKTEKSQKNEVFRQKADAFIGMCPEPYAWQGKPIFHCDHSNSAFGAGYMVCLTAGGRPRVRWEKEVYRLTIEAHEELMGAPVGFTESIISIAKRRMACGDGIVVPLAKAIGTTIRQALEDTR